MFRKEFSLLLVISALFSGQIMAEHKGHEFVYVKNADHQLRHEADSDELRSAAEESAEGLREHHAWQKSGKPDTHSAG
ncbi:YncJ family protein [Enterobacter hormaechei subsp. xiangfangensis]|uniref:YncJ family protein n=1 Tax=Enterobacter hormaechei TaxID=158836 RepID=UPI002239050F|nr:YncJ family protein [Enterobacter hormaechei]MCW5038595.1 YncJ family protein [Enterobacter hormaechei subsp. xiangfangensis]